MSERRDSGASEKYSSSESLTICKASSVTKRDWQTRNKQKARTGLDPQKAVTVEKVTLEKRRPSLQRPIQQQYR